MTNEYKEQIFQAMQAFFEEGNSAAELSKRSTVNAGYISSIRNRKWDDHAGTPVPEWVFRKIGSTLQVNSNIVHLNNYLNIFGFLQECRENSEARIVDGAPGTGKSYTCKQYTLRHAQTTFMVTCAGDLNEKRFMIEMAKAVCGNIYSHNQWVLMNRPGLRREVTIKLANISNPLLIIDEAENLQDGSYGAIKAIYDELEGRCGFVLVGANDYIRTLEKKSSKWYDRSCVPQVYSRFRANPLKLESITSDDVKKAVDAYGFGEHRELYKSLLSAPDLRALFNTLKRERRVADVA